MLNFSMQSDFVFLPLLCALVASSVKVGLLSWIFDLGEAPKGHKFIESWFTSLSLLEGSLLALETGVEVKCSYMHPSVAYASRES